MSELRRDLGLGSAVVTGLGSILGTGAFVAIALAFDFAGSWIILAVPAAAVVAVFNGLSSAALAAIHPVAGGTYEYGTRFLGPWPGFVAGGCFSSPNLGRRPPPVSTSRWSGSRSSVSPPSWS